MFREMRRIHQQMPDEDAKKILKNADYGTLAVIGDGGDPYAVPLNYVYYNGKIYVHCAKKGHKVDAVNNCAKASFTVVGEEKVLKEKYTSYYKSVIAFGTAKTVEDENLKREAVMALSKKYVTFSDEEIMKEVNSFASALCVIELTIEHLTGKEYKPQV